MWFAIALVWLLGVCLVWPLLYAYGEQETSDRREERSASR